MSTPAPDPHHATEIARLKGLAQPTKIAIALLLTASLWLTAGDAPDARARLNCHNNLKFIGGAVAQFALENKNVAPKDFSVLTNYLTSPAVFWCPGDTTRTKPKDETWKGYDPKNATYKLVSPGGVIDGTATNELVWCPVHNCVSYLEGKQVKSKEKKR